MTSTVRRSLNYDAAYIAQRLKLTSVVSAAVARTFTGGTMTRAQLAQAAVPIVETGQAHMAALVDAYMAAKSVQATGTGSVIGLDPADYTISKLRNGVPATDVYGRPVGAFFALGDEGRDPAEALTGARATLDKLARTDLQLAQTHAARDWMSAFNEQAAPEQTIVGYRRVLSGPGPHCALCEAAATRTYNVGDLMPIHEHCGCTVQPVWGEEHVTEPAKAAYGVTLRIEDDPEIGPRLMADSWAPVGPALAY